MLFNRVKCGILFLNKQCSHKNLENQIELPRRSYAQPYRVNKEPEILTRFNNRPAPPDVDVEHIVVMIFRQATSKCYSLEI